MLVRPVEVKGPLRGLWRFEALVVTSQHLDPLREGGGRRVLGNHHLHHLRHLEHSVAYNLRWTCSIISLKKRVSISWIYI